MSIYLGRFDCFDDVVERFTDYNEDYQRDFEAAKAGEFAGVEILFAYYDVEGYNGRAFVLFLKDGKLFEVHGSHCSCMGLEGQWDPEETTTEALTHSIAKGMLGKDYDGANEFATELTVLLGLNAQGLPWKDAATVARTMLRLEPAQTSRDKD